MEGSNQQICHDECGEDCFTERFKLNNIALQVSLLLKASLGVGPDEVDNLASHVLRVEAEESCDPGDCLALV